MSFNQETKCWLKTEHPERWNQHWLDHIYLLGSKILKVMLVYWKMKMGSNLIVVFHIWFLLIGEGSKEEFDMEFCSYWSLYSFSPCIKIWRHEDMTEILGAYCRDVNYVRNWTNWTCSLVYRFIVVACSSIYCSIRVVHGSIPSSHILFCSMLIYSVGECWKLCSIYCVWCWWNDRTLVWDILWVVI